MISPATGYKIGRAPVVTETNGSGTVTVSPVSDGTYTFTMPAYSVTVDAATYSIPEEITYTATTTEATARGNTYDPTTSATVGDNERARGFTFEVNSGGTAMTSVAVTASGASKSAYGDADATAGTTATATFSKGCTGTVVFGIMIYAGSRETAATVSQQNAIQGFNAATGFTVSIN